MLKPLIDVEEPQVSATKIGRDGTIDLRDAIGMDTPKALALWMDVVESSERASQVAGLSKSDRRRLVALLDTETAIELFESIDNDLGARLVGVMPIAKAAEQLDGLDATRTAAILRHVDRAKMEPILAAMPPSGPNRYAPFSLGLRVRLRRTCGPMFLRSVRRRPLPKP